MSKEPIIGKTQKWYSTPSWLFFKRLFTLFISPDISVCCCSVTKSCLTLCDPMNYSTSGFPVLHYLPEFAKTHVPWVTNAILPSHPLLLLPAFNLSHHQDLFQRVGSSHQVAKVLELQLQHGPSNEYSGLISFRIGLISLLSKGLSRIFSSTTVWKHQFFSSQPSFWSNSHICIWLLEKPWLWLCGHLWAKWCLCVLIFCLGLS